ncbi:hypothetical protein D3C72_1323480 [compost metagenome]
MRAPRRTISFTCMKRFSKMVSVTIEAPRAITFRAMNWACMSVGKPGYSVVLKLCAFRWSYAGPCEPMRMPSGSVTTVQPASRSLSITASRWSPRA